MKCESVCSEMVEEELSKSCCGSKKKMWGERRLFNSKRRVLSRTLVLSNGRNDSRWE